MLVLDLAQVFDQVASSSGVDVGDAFQLPRRILRVLCGHFERQRRVQFEGSDAEPLQTITTILLGSKWSCLLLRMLLHYAQSEVTKVCRCSFFFVRRHNQSCRTKQRATRGGRANFPKRKGSCGGKKGSMMFNYSRRKGRDEPCHLVV